MIQVELVLTLLSIPLMIMAKNCDSFFHDESCYRYYDCKVTEKGAEYKGFISVSEQGLNCQAWSKQSPHKHRFNASYFPDEDFDTLENKCRNTDGGLRPWCYTTDPKHEWDYCNIPLCFTDCRLSKSGLEYKGQISVTETGRTCQEWSKQYPHPHNYYTKQFFKYENLDKVSNYCRNFNAKRPWCYTVDKNKQWEYCNIPFCYREKATLNRFKIAQSL